MQSSSEAHILDITRSSKYETYLHRCLTGPLSKRYRKRLAFLDTAIPCGFHKKLLIYKSEIIGTIEYSPSEISYYPIKGKDIVVMNCIWVLRKAKGHNFGRMLIKDMLEREKEASGFSTIGLTGHWSPWFRKEQMEHLGFKSLDSMSVVHMTKHRDRPFSIHLMWMPIAEDAVPPSWDQGRLLEGITACIAHPLYHPQSYKPQCIFQETRGQI
ncbi:MAG: hypothetical protein EAX81_07435 [Candidatus Thorarchaeota archaeon]|nr:hypothetical protein [Candidatus Thorarchaeota archaeon]